MIEWRHWHNEPLLIGGLVFVGWLWAVLAGPWRTRLAARSGEATPPFPTRHAVRFYAGLLIFYLAVGSPLDQVAETYLFSAHMVQHQLLVYPAAILFLLGVPYWMADAALRHPALQATARLVTRPVVTALTFLLVVGVWHAPWLYTAALNDKLVHILEHVMFFGAALLYWWPLLSPSRVLPPISYAGQMLYLVAVLIGMMPIHAYITFSHDTLYPNYEFAPRLFPGLSPEDDQLLAGVTMQVVTISVSLVAFTVAFARWYLAGEKRAPLARARTT